MIRKGKLFLILTALCVFAGCGDKIENVKESTVTADEKGTVTQVLIEEFPAAEYNAETLEADIRSLVKEYNQKTGAGKIAMDSFEWEKGTAKAVLSYDSDEDYRAFNQVDFFAGTAAQALTEGYTFAGDFTDAKGNDIKGQSVLDKAKSQKVIIIREPLQVLVSGKILYVSKNMEVLSADTAKMTAKEKSVSNASTEAFGYVIYEEE